MVTREEKTLTRDAHDFAPWNTEVEQTLLGIALINNRSVAFMQSDVAAADFYLPLHQRVFERVFAKYEADRPVTPLTLHAAMKNDADLVAAGGLSYFAGCADMAVPSISIEGLQRNVKSLARSVADLAMRRRGEEAILDAIERMRQGVQLEDALRPITDIAEEETGRGEAQSGSVSIIEAGHQVLTELENEDPDAAVPRSPTGMPRLDEILGGVADSNLLVVGGRPGMGKSIFGTTAAIAAARAGFDVDYFSLEMTARELTIRMLCDIDYDRALSEGWQPIQYSRVFLRRLSPDERMRLVEANLLLSDLPIEIHDRDELTMRQIAGIARSRKASRSNQRRRAIIDHMHLIEPSDRYAGRKVDEISEITRGCKRMAKRLEIGVILLAQLNRAIEARDNKLPTMADFRDAGSIEQDADSMIGLNRPHYWLQREHPKDAEAEGKRTTEMIAKANVLEAGIIKNRHGATCDLTLYCDVACSVFRDEMPTRQSAIDFGSLGKF